MPRYRLTLEYDGTPFAGWQRVTGQPSVQAALEEAVSRFCGEQARVVAAGRTDAGVHAAGQVAHVDLSAAHEPQRVMGALNFHLLTEAKQRFIAVIDAALAPEGFHARFSATARHYRYRILNRRPPPALEAGRVWHVAEPLDVPAMQAAAALLAGHHDFTSFRATACQSPSPVKTLERLEVSRAGEEIHIEASARSFLHHQVRIMAGTLAEVGKGRRTPEDVSAALEARDRRAGGLTAPPQGLCLMKVDY